MHDYRRFLCAVALATFASGAAPRDSHAQGERVVAFTGTGYAGIGVAVTSIGDVLHLEEHASAWVPVGNVFIASGQARAGRDIVGMFGPGIAGIRALATDGTLFSGDGGDWVAGLNIWESAGRDPGSDHFVALGWTESCGGGYAYAATAAGETFRQDLGSSLLPWVYTGNINGGATAARTASWGEIKARHR